MTEPQRRKAKALYPMLNAFQRVDLEHLEPDPGCRACTHGTTPDKYHTGKCLYHAVEAFLRELELID